MIPVILIHSGYPDYLNLSIKKALNSNLVYLIGDVKPDIEHENFTFFNLNEFINEHFMKFTSIYEHLSTNPYNFELFCFLRWFILKEFMIRKDLEVSFYIDSDVLLYGSTYDHNINVSDQDFDFKNGIKNVQMIDGHPWVFSNKLNKLIKFNSLHFNSGAKSLMSKYF